MKHYIWQSLVQIKRFVLSLIRKLKQYAIVSIVSMIVSCIVTIRVIHEIQPKADISKASVSTISGAPLTIGKITTKNKTTTISTSYSGAGESDISIPNKMNPSANFWDNHHWGAGAMIGTNLTYSIIGSYRYERVMFLGSAWFKNSNGYEFGLGAGALYIF